MRIVITGHRTEKLATYDFGWIQSAIDDVLIGIKTNNSSLLAYSGMASGVDLYFCKACMLLGIPYIACVPFEGQEKTMSPNDANAREKLLKTAKEIKSVKNSWMVEHCDVGIVVWDGNKGGTHNALQQLIEFRKNFYWINPCGKVTWKCFLTSPQNVI
jgi:uncharacterized phage-like protein YoqJ